MGSNYTVTSAKMGNGSPDNYGNVPWWIDLTDGEQAYEALVMRKPDSPTPQGQVYGRIETKTSQAGNEYLRFYTEQNPNGAPQQTPVAGNATGGNVYNPPPRPNTSGDGSPAYDPKQVRIEAQSARRDAIAYAALVMAGPGQTSPPTPPTIEQIKTWAKELALDEAVPSPSAPPAASGGTPAPAPQAPATMGGAPAVDFASQDIRLALAACGQDNSNPALNYAKLEPEIQAQVDLIYQNLKSKGVDEVSEIDPDGWKTPDDEIDF